jgi:cobalt-zinc-cadmium efflux system membrane fusion protein
VVKTFCRASVIAVLAAAPAACNRSGSPPAVTTQAAPGAERPDDPAAGAWERPGAGAGQGRSYLLPRRGFGRGAGRGWGRRSITLTAAEEKSIALSTIRVSYRPIRSRLSAMGAVYAPPGRKAIVSYPFAGRVVGVHVKPGDWVRASQPVVTLLSDEVGIAKGEYYRARAAVDLSESSHEREKRLFDRGVGARKSLLLAENELRVARAALDAVEKRLNVLGLSNDQVRALRVDPASEPTIVLRAPISGKVVESTPVLGTMVDASTAILNVLDPSTLCVDAEVYERDLAKLRIGQGVALSVAAYPGETFNGRVCYIADVVSPETRTIIVRTEIGNRDHRLKPGMFASVSFFLSDETRVLALPERAVLDNRDEKLVFVRADDGYLPQVVQVGIKHEGYYEIVRGLNEGDEVVMNGNFQLKSKLFEDVLKSAASH